MPYLQQEQTWAQAEIQAADAVVTSLTTQVDIQRQALVSAQAQVDVARNALMALQSQRPALDAAVSAADRAVIDLNRRISEHEANEPPQVIGGVDPIVGPLVVGPLTRPVRPNPAWKVWKRQQGELIQQRNQAQVEANGAHARLNELNARVTQAQAGVQAAEARVAQEEARLEQVNQSLVVARDRASAARQKLNDLVHFGEEIDREPMDRKALEQVAAILSARAMELEDALAVARALSAQADATLSSLLRRRDELVNGLAAVTSQLPGAETAVQAADVVAVDRLSELQAQIEGGP
jgi:chromosome segregation ATPase